MPKVWTTKDERMYRHIMQSCTRARSKPKSVCKSIAAATVNKLRKKQGRTLSGLSPEQVFTRCYEANKFKMSNKGLTRKCDSEAYGRPLSGFVLEASRRSANDPETGGWAPGWFRFNKFVGDAPYRTRAEAQAAIAKRGLKGAKYRVKSDGLGCGCEGKRR